MISRPLVFKRFVGRGAELDHLSTRRREAAARRGGIVLVAGEAGVGKSRLLAEFSEAFETTRTKFVRASCRDAMQSAFGPMRDILRALEPSRAVPAFASPDERLDDALDAFARSAGRATTVIVVEDVHWADPDFLAAIGVAAERAVAQRLLFVVSYRADEVVSSHRNVVAIGRLSRGAAASAITLQALSQAQIQGLMRASSRNEGIEIPPLRLAEAAHVSDGNPLFGEELLRHAVDGGFGGRNDAAMPISLRGIVQERIRRCESSDRNLLQTAAVCGRRFDVPILAAVANRPEADVRSALERACGLQLLVPVLDASDSFEFRHVLTREAIYAELADTETIPLHRRIAAHLAQSGAGAGHELEVAYHRWRGSDPDAKAFEDAARAARRDLDYVAAVAWYDRAVEATGGGVRRSSELRLAQTSALIAAGESDRALQLLERLAHDARTAGDDDETFVRSRKLAAGVLANDGRRDAAIRLLERTLAELSELTDRHKAELLLRIANYRALATDPAAAIETLARVPPAAVEGNSMLAAEYAASLSWLGARTFEEAAWRTNSTRAIRIYEAIGAPKFVRFQHVNVAWQAHSMGLLADAREHAHTALETFGESAAVSSDAPLTLALVALSSGGYREAMDWLEAAPVTPDFMSRKTRAACAVEAAVALGDEAALAANLDVRLLNEAESIDDVYGRLRLSVAFATGFDALGRSVEADRLYASAAALMTSSYQCVPGMLAIARIRPALAKAPRAVLAAEPGLARSTFLRAALALVDAEIARYEGDRAREALQAGAARAAFGKLGWRALEARAAELAGDLEAALALHHACGNLVEERRLRATISVRAPIAFSDREREVARHVVSGLGNRAVAESMAISVKTVEKHLASIYVKCGVSSREGLRAWSAARENVVRG